MNKLIFKLFIICLSLCFTKKGNCKFCTRGKCDIDKRLQDHDSECRLDIYYHYLEDAYQ